MCMCLYICKQARNEFIKKRQSGIRSDVVTAHDGDNIIVDKNRQMDSSEALHRNTRA